MDGRGLQGRGTARGLIALVILFGLLVGFLWIAQPGTMGPQPSWFETPFPIAVASYLVGLVWMIRIYRDRPEEADPAWR